MSRRGRGSAAAAGRAAARAELERLLRRSAARLGVEGELFAELLELFLDHSESDCALLAAALVTGDLAAAASAAHSLKGAALALRLDDASRLASRLEELLATESVEAGAVFESLQLHLADLRDIHGGGGAAP